MPLPQAKQQLANQTYLVLTGLFVAALISCNLIANKFISINLGFKTFIISAGVLPYPITFLLTDILSEIYGKKKTSQVVWVGLVASIFVLGILQLGNLFPAIENSPVNDEVYSTTFANAWRVIGASMLAYLTAQLVDVQLFHFWKKKTKGRMLWVRNNFSTVLSQLVDTTLVVTVLFIEKESLGTIGGYIFDGWLFKTLVALVDTPLIYAATWGFRKVFNLKFGEELPVT